MQASSDIYRNETGKDISLFKGNSRCYRKCVFTNGSQSTDILRSGQSWLHSVQALPQIFSASHAITLVWSRDWKSKSCSEYVYYQLKPNTVLCHSHYVAQNWWVSELLQVQVDQKHSILHLSMQKSPTLRLLNMFCQGKQTTFLFILQFHLCCDLSLPCCSWPFSDSYLQF